MEFLIWAGAAVSLIGLAGIVTSIVTISLARRARLEDAVMREKLRRAMTLNLAALFVSVIGLMMVVVGVMLG